MAEVYEVIKSIGVVGLLWGSFTFWKDYDWRRKRFTVDLFLRSSDARSRADQALIVKAFPQMLTASPGRGPSRDECHAILRSARGELIRGNDAFEVRQALMAQFNAIEPIAMAYNYKLVDLQAIDTAIGTVILRWYDFFVDFIDAAKEVRGDHPWPSISVLVTDLKQNRFNAAR